MGMLMVFNATFNNISAINKTGNNLHILQE